MQQLGACGRRGVNPINLLIDRRAARADAAGLNRQRTCACGLPCRFKAFVLFVYSTRSARRVCLRDATATLLKSASEREQLPPESEATYSMHDSLLHLLALVLSYTRSVHYT